MDTIRRLEQWTAAQCNGSWEHFHGVSISTSDNPAWSVRISLIGTQTHGKHIPTFRSIDFEVNESDWVECKLSDDGSEFWGVGDITKLSFFIEYFLKYAQ